MSFATELEQIPAGPLTPETVQQSIAPLFQQVLSRHRIYLANHSLGRPPDQTGADLAEAFQLWTSRLGDAWDAWLAEREAYRARLATLLNAPRRDCIVPRENAAQGLRAVLNALPGVPQVLSTRGEFDSTDLVLKQYAAAGRIHLRLVEPDHFTLDGTPLFTVDAVLRALTLGTQMVVVSQVFFQTGQVLAEIPRLAEACREHNALLLLDSYHAVGVLPVDVQALGADVMIGASYKYLRGGPGAGYFYLSPRFLERNYVPLDAGWFAKDSHFNFARSERPRLARGGDAYLDATPPIFTWYQARAGQQFLLAAGVERLRAYSLAQLAYFKQKLAENDVPCSGGDARYGAFLVVRHPQAGELCKRLAQHGIDTDSRGSSLRICPDCLTTQAEMDRTAEVLGELWSDLANADKGNMY